MPGPDAALLQRQLMRPDADDRGCLRVSPRPRAQSTLEYALFVGVVAAALAAMAVYVRRAINANLKVVEDQINAEAIN